VPYAGVAGRHALGRFFAVPGTDVDVDVVVGDAPVAAVATGAHARHRDALDEPVPTRDHDALTGEDLGLEAAERAVGEQAVAADVRHREANLVDVADHRERESVRRPDTGEGCPERVAGDLGELACRGAPYGGRGLLVSRRSGRSQKVVEDRGYRHELRIQAAAPILVGDDSFPAHELVVLARERGGSVRLGRTTALPRSASRPNRVFFVAPNGVVSKRMSTTIHTDLLTPLSAYLRLRSHGAGSFLLESVDQGRLGRYSLVGSGSRLIGVDEAEQCTEPVEWVTLGYDWIAELEPTVPLPGQGSGLPVSRLVIADRLLRFDHVAGVSEVVQGDPDEMAAVLARAAQCRPPLRLSGGPLSRFPDRATHGPGSCAARSTSAPATPFRSCSRSEPNDRRRRRLLPSTGRCGGSTRRRTCSCSSSATTR
jgi:hypothetical protein